MIESFEDIEAEGNDAVEKMEQAVKVMSTALSSCSDGFRKEMGRCLDFEQNKSLSEAMQEYGAAHADTAFQSLLLLEIYAVAAAYPEDFNFMLVKASKVWAELFPPES